MNSKVSVKLNSVFGMDIFSPPVFIKTSKLLNRLDGVTK